MILHGDLDAFYAAVAQRDDPTLRGKPIVVAGSSRRAVVLTASYEARPYGIQSAMPLFQAKERCADLIVVPPQSAKYREASDVLFEILHRHAKTVEGISMDEAFCDVGDVTLDDALKVGQKIKWDVRDELALTISIGAATSKMVAKIASDDGKPDGLVGVAPGTEAEYLKDKPIRRLWGIGPKTEKRVRERGIERIGQIGELSDEALYDVFGRWGAEVRELARGVDQRTVSDGDVMRSISSEETFEYDVAKLEDILPVIRSQSEELSERLKRRALRARTVAIKIKLSNFQIVGRQTSLAQPTHDARIIYAAAKFCLYRAKPPKPVRLVGVKVASLEPLGAKQIALFAGQLDIHAPVEQ